MKKGYIDIYKIMEETEAFIRKYYESHDDIGFKPSFGGMFLSGSKEEIKEQTIKYLSFLEDVCKWFIINIADNCELKEGDDGYFIYQKIGPLFANRYAREKIEKKKLSEEKSTEV